MSIETFKRFIEENFELLWDYRFFYRETVALLNADPALKERQTEIIKQRFERQLNILQQAEKDGIFHFPEPDVRLDEVLTIVWIVANHYLVHLESMGQVVDYHDFENGGFTAVICLTESHLSIHTWPEFKLATFDIFLSNYQKDNSEKVRGIYKEVLNFFEGIENQKTELTR